MTILFGSSGYIGSVFAQQLTKAGKRWVAGDRAHFQSQLLEYPRPTTVINAAAYIPGGATTNCDAHPAETLLANAILPIRLADACVERGHLFVHMSTGCLWNDGLEHAEDDPPQRGFGGYSGTYVGAKLLAEKVVSTMPRHYIFRLRLPFDNVAHPRNYLTKLAVYLEIFDQTNSISHRADCVAACLQLLEKDAPFGTYNIVNPGALAAADITTALFAQGIRTHPLKLVPGPGGAAILSTAKLQAAGVTMRPVAEAFQDALDNWNGKMV